MPHLRPAALGFLTLMSATACFPVHPPRPIQLTPVVRYQNALYVGCGQGATAVDGAFPNACGSPDPAIATRPGPVVFQVSADLGTKTLPWALGDRESHDLPGSTPVYSYQGSDPSERLVARWGEGFLVLDRHPASNARTLGELVAADYRLTAMAPLSSDTVLAVELKTPSGRSVTVEGSERLGPLMRDMADAPIDWTSGTQGDPHELTVYLVGGQTLELTYYPAADTMVYKLQATQTAALRFPVRAPAGIEALLADAS